MNPVDRFDIICPVGEGGYARVFKAYDKQRAMIVAIKIINLSTDEDNIDGVHQEISVMSTIELPQLTRYYESYVVENNDLWIIMEYLEGGSLLDIMKHTGQPLAEIHIPYILKQLTIALCYLHKERKIHRDIKAGNLLVSTEGAVKLADFGVTAQLTDAMDKRTTKIGTPFWMAPEVIQESKYDEKADIWSTGITAIELSTGLPPYAKKVHPLQVLKLIPNSEPPSLSGDGYSDGLKDFIATCLKKDPSKRPTAEELLRHPYIASAERTAEWMKFIENDVIEPGRIRESKLLQQQMEAQQKAIESYQNTISYSKSRNLTIGKSGGFGSDACDQMQYDSTIRTSTSINNNMSGLVKAGENTFRSSRGSITSMSPIAPFPVETYLHGNEENQMLRTDTNASLALTESSAGGAKFEFDDALMPFSMDRSHSEGTDFHLPRDAIYETEGGHSMRDRVPVSFSREADKMFISPRHHLDVDEYEITPPQNVRNSRMSEYQGGYSLQDDAEKAVETESNEFNRRPVSVDGGPTKQLEWMIQKQKRDELELKKKIQRLEEENKMLKEKLSPFMALIRMNDEESSSRTGDPDLFPHPNQSKLQESRSADPNLTLNPYYSHHTPTAQSFQNKHAGKDNTSEPSDRDSANHHPSADQRSLVFLNVLEPTIRCLRNKLPSSVDEKTKEAASVLNVLDSSLRALDIISSRPSSGIKSHASHHPTHWSLEFSTTLCGYLGEELDGKL